MPETPPNLTKYLADRQIASRRKSEELIRAGRVRVNGVAETNPARRIASDDAVECNGVEVSNKPERKVYILLNKPRGYVCTAADVHAPLKAADLINLPGIRLFSAGRLDKDSSGALIFSNDGDYVAKLTHPSNNILKRYVVETMRPLPPDTAVRLRRGIRDDGEVLRAVKVIEIANRKYEFVLNEGRKREIRRMTAALGAPTLTLTRIAVGKLELGTLESGKWRELSLAEVGASLVPNTIPEEK